MTRAGIVHASTTRYTRHPEPGTTTVGVLAEAVLQVTREAGVRLSDVDGLGVASFTLGPDHAVDLAWKLGLSTRWLAEDPHGGVSGTILLQNAIRAIEAGDATTIVLVAGDHFTKATFASLAANYNLATRHHLAPLEHGGPNSLFAMLTQRQFDERGIGERDLAHIPLTQRWWAQANPGAVYGTPLSFEDYLDDGYVFAPLRRYDCVPVVTGAEALLLRADPAGPHVEVTGVVTSFNHDHQRDGGLLGDTHRHVSEQLYDRAGLGPDDVDLAGIYDDYPAMVLEQALAFGLAQPGSEAKFLADRIAQQRWPLNTSGGQLSYGQAGCAGGMHFLTEACLQLLERTPGRQVENAEIALVTGYGMVLYRFGAALTGTILRRRG